MFTIEFTHSALEDLEHVPKADPVLILIRGKAFQP